MTELFSEKQLEEYSLALLKWAYGKTGSRIHAEELAQEVWLQVYRSAQKTSTSGRLVLLAENYLWRIAHHVWCRKLRGPSVCFCSSPLEELPLADEESDHAAQHAEREEKVYFLQKMRRKLMELNRLQREIMIRFYLDGHTQKEIAQSLNIAVSTVKWHLFDTRQKLKEELMENNEFVYRPVKMVTSICGSVENFDTNNGLQSSLSRQNICLVCYRKAQSIESLSRMLGIPQPYLENDVQWLLDKELLQKDENGYRTAFLIENRQEAQERYAIYLKLKTQLSDVIVQELLAAEDRIRAIGFEGSSQPMSKLLWLLIYRLADQMLVEEKEAEPPFRKDGKYYMLGFDSSEPEKMVLHTKDWNHNGTMSDGEGFFWFGLEHFDFADPVHLFLGEKGMWERLKTTLSKILNGQKDFSALTEQERYDTAALVEKGFLSVSNDKASPCFCVFTPKEYQALKTDVLGPIVHKLTDIVAQRDAELQKLCQKQVPKHLSHLVPVATRMARYDLSFLTAFFAYEDGHLYRPNSEKDGAMLTLMYIKPE